VVITCPVATLQHRGSEDQAGAFQFHPPLPEWKQACLDAFLLSKNKSSTNDDLRALSQKAINALGMGKENKVFLFFDNANVFWREKKTPYIQVRYLERK